MEEGTGNLSHFLTLICPCNFQIKMQINKWFIFKLVGFIFRLNQMSLSIGEVKLAFFSNF